MRQAGRYLPEYNATRARAGSFLKLAKTPALAAEVTLQPLERFPLDAAILFSDILTIPDAMGLGLAFAEGEGPRFERPLRDEADIRQLGRAGSGAELRYVLDAVRESRAALAGRVPLIGFSGSPFTLACYMVEGSGSDDWRTLKTHAARASRPAAPHPRGQRPRGHRLPERADRGRRADAVMLFDTWGGILAHDDYETFSLAYARKIFEQVTQSADDPVHEGRQPVARRDDAERLQLRSGLDWTCDPRAARRLAAGRVALQGNLDPAALFAPPERVREAARKVLDSFGASPATSSISATASQPRTPVGYRWLRS